MILALLSAVFKCASSFPKKYRIYSRIGCVMVTRRPLAKLKRSHSF